MRITLKKTINGTAKIDENVNIFQLIETNLEVQLLKQFKYIIYNSDVKGFKIKICLTFVSNIRIDEQALLTKDTITLVSKQTKDIVA